MNPYEISELEAKELYCELCNNIMSTSQYLNNEGVCDICLLKGDKTMNTEMELLALENRIALLRGRTNKENGKIVKKLLRRQRKLKNA